MASEIGNQRYVDNRIIPRLLLGEQNLREETIRHHLNRYDFAKNHVKPGDIAIDLCCGTGYGTDILRNAGCEEAIGVDLSSDAITHAKNTYSDAVYINDNVIDFLEAIPISHQPNIVTFFEAIEHISPEDGLAVLDAVQGNLASDGNFFISTPRDIRSDVNPDHITQWEFKELREALEERFASVEIIGQDWATGEFSASEPWEASFFIGKCSQPRR